MKHLVILASMALALTVAAAAQAETTSFEKGSSFEKAEGLHDWSADTTVEKQKRKRKRKHTGLDDGPNHT